MTMVRWSGPVGRPSDKARKKKYRIAAIVAVASLTAVFLVLQGLDSITGASELNNSSTLSLLRERPWDDAVADECEKAVNRLVMKEIRLAAIDFDATILDFHTGGEWEGTARELVPHVRPELQCYISHCLEKGIRVAVVTFSAQTELIAIAMQAAIPLASADEIVVFGGNDHVKGYTAGKQSQLLLSMNLFNKLQKSSRGTKLKISPSVTVLIDDDTDNIDIAHKDGYKTIAFEPDHPSSLFHNPLSWRPR